MRSGNARRRMEKVALVREWDPDTFHSRVRKLEAQGYVAHLDTYCVTPKMNPETGEVIHLYTIELCHPDLNDKTVCAAS